MADGPLVITSISNPSRSGMCAVRAGKERVATLDAATISRLNLARGTELTPALREQLKALSGYTQCRLDAIRALGRRALSRKKLAERLRRKEHAPDVIETVCDELTAKGLINDEQLAQNMAATMVSGKPAGRRLVEAKLAQRGIARPTASRAAREAAETRDAHADAMKLGRARLARMPSHLEPEAKRRRLFGVLARRGFDPDVAGDVVRKLLREADDGGYA